MPLILFPGSVQVNKMDQDVVNYILSNHKHPSSTPLITSPSIYLVHVIEIWYLSDIYGYDSYLILAYMVYLVCDIHV
mgnify:CR=1 FL=1